MHNLPQIFGGWGIVPFLIPWKGVTNPPNMICHLHFNLSSRVDEKTEEILWDENCTIHFTTTINNHRAARGQPTAGQSQTSQQVGWPKKQYLHPNNHEEFVLTTKHPGQLCCPPSLLSNGYIRALSQRDWGIKMPTQLLLPARLRKTGGITLLSHIPSRHAQGQFYMLRIV